MSIADDASLPRRLEQSLTASEPVSREVEAQLVQQAKRGDRAAFAVLYHNFVTPIYRYCWLHAGGSKEDAEDLTSRVFLQALQSIGQYQERGRPFLAWLHTIARNLVTDYLRRQGRTVILDDALPSPSTVAEEVGIRLEHEQLRRAMAQLTAEQRRVVVYRFVLGYQSDQTAAVMGKRPGAVRALQMRALQTLRELLEREQA
jgi:RNA polymerase sigma-70 factor (ECF subfamily)